ncbi:hypothetical protein [Colwellia sp. 75C3]|uniref:hypothetical protein n=1 Tax=Colwellia sp. 75C3 TaxID=888425 RepID=UPI0012FEEBC2|nr:hypothetical protein [Colwellia sp. 75C3]
MELEMFLGKALIEENSYSIVEINNAAKSISKPALRGRMSKAYSLLPPFLRTPHGCSLLDNAGAHYPE